jgi:hypothetical protein
MTESKPTTGKREIHEGEVPSLATPEERNAAFDQAFDYRGDVTITTKDGKSLEGYIFDRRSKIAEPYVRMIPRDTDDRVNIKYADISSIVFSGKDTAAGKSWETWIKKYVEKKSKGEAASIESEKLD